jgi:hypothetical protein
VSSPIDGVSITVFAATDVLRCRLNFRSSSEGLMMPSLTDFTNCGHDSELFGVYFLNLSLT